MLSLLSIIGVLVLILQFSQLIFRLTFKYNHLFNMYWIIHSFLSIVFIALTMFATKETIIVGTIYIVIRAICIYIQNIYYEKNKELNKQ